jgi:hypothetical protein
VTARRLGIIVCAAVASGGLSAIWSISSGQTADNVVRMAIISFVLVLVIGFVAELILRKE